MASSDKVWHYEQVCGLSFEIEPVKFTFTGEDQRFRICQEMWHWRGLLLLCVKGKCGSSKWIKWIKRDRPLVEIFTQPTPQGHNRCYMINATLVTHATNKQTQKPTNDAVWSLKKM